MYNKKAICCVFSWLARTDPADVARVESKTLISTPDKNDTIPTPKDGVEGTLGHWISPDDLDAAIQERFPGTMKGELNGTPTFITKKKSPESL